MPRGHPNSKRQGAPRRHLPSSSLSDFHERMPGLPGHRSTIGSCMRVPRVPVRVGFRFIMHGPVQRSRSGHPLCRPGGGDARRFENLPGTSPIPQRRIGRPFGTTTAAFPPSRYLRVGRVRSRANGLGVKTALPGAHVCPARVRAIHSSAFPPVAWSAPADARWLARISFGILSGAAGGSRTRHVQQKEVDFEL